MRCVVSAPENQLRSTIAAGTDVGQVGLARNQAFGRSEVADEEFPVGIVDEHILRLHVAMGDSDLLEVEQPLEHLESQYF